MQNKALALLLGTYSNRIIRQEKVERKKSAFWFFNMTSETKKRKYCSHTCSNS